MAIKYNTKWYNDLIKPEFQPPAWVFAPAWSVLYILMFVSFLLILKAEVRPISIYAYALFVLQLILNLSWSPIFFELHQLKKAFWVCISLTVTVFLMMVVFAFISKLAGILLIPYFLWLCFACALNFKIWKLNLHS